MFDLARAAGIPIAAVRGCPWSGWRYWVVAGPLPEGDDIGDRVDRPSIHDAKRPDLLAGHPVPTQSNPRPLDLNPLSGSTNLPSSPGAVAANDRSTPDKIHDGRAKIWAGADVSAPLSAPLREHTEERGITMADYHLVALGGREATSCDEFGPRRLQAG